MTDRLKALTVVLERDIRVDDAEELIKAIKQLRGVLNVQEEVSELEDHVAYSRARTHLAEKLWEVLYPKKKEE